MGRTRPCSATSEGRQRWDARPACSHDTRKLQLGEKVDQQDAEGSDWQCMHSKSHWQCRRLSVLLLLFG